MIQKNSTALLFLFSVITVFFVTSCDPSKKAEKEEENAIQEYLAQNPDLEFERKASGLYYHEVLEGTGELAVRSDTAYIKYTAKFLDGTTFDSNVETDDTLIRPVDEGWLIEGFDEGLTYMKQGGKALFLIPSSLGYGNSGYYFPGYTPTLFEVELVLLKPGTF